MSNHFSGIKYDARVLCLVMCYRSHEVQTVYSVCTSFRKFIILCVYEHTGLYATCSSFVVQIFSESTDQLLHLDPQADWKDGRRDFFATFDLILFHSHTVKYPKSHFSVTYFGSIPTAYVDSLRPRRLLILRLMACGTDTISGRYLWPNKPPPTYHITTLIVTQ